MLALPAWKPRNVFAAVVLAAVAYWLVRGSLLGGAARSSARALKTWPATLESATQTVSLSPGEKGTVRSALVVGEHAGMRQLLKLILGGLALEVSEASSEQHGQSTGSSLPSLAVVDIDTSFEQGMVVWHSLRRNPSTASIPSVFLVEAGNEVMHRLADMAGASICLEKPFHPRDLRATVERLLEPGAGLDPADAG